MSDKFIAEQSRRIDELQQISASLEEIMRRVSLTRNRHSPITSLNIRPYNNKTRRKCDDTLGI
jgi:hypothetical protein